MRISENGGVVNGVVNGVGRRRHAQGPCWQRWKIKNGGAVQGAVTSAWERTTSAVVAKNVRVTVWVTEHDYVGVARSRGQRRGRRGHHRRHESRNGGVGNGVGHEVGRRWRDVSSITAAWETA